MTLKNPTDQQVVDDFQRFVKNKNEFGYTPKLKSLKIIQNLNEKGTNASRWSAIFPVTLSWTLKEYSEGVPEAAFSQFIIPYPQSYKRLVSVRAEFSSQNQIESYQEEPKLKSVWKALHLVPVLGAQGCPVPKCVGQKTAAKYFSKVLKDKQGQRRIVDSYLPAGMRLEETGYFADGYSSGRT